MESTVMQELYNSVTNFDEEAAEAAAKKAIETGIDPFKAIVEGLTPAIKQVGEKFENGDLFLPHLVMAGDAMMAAVKILEKKIPREELESTIKGRIVLGTVKGDVHSIGKNIVGIMLTCAGYKVYDLGIEVDHSKFIDEAEKVNADIIAVSALMTFTAQNMATLHEFMTAEGIRNKYLLLFGGGPLTEKWAKQMGADAYALDAAKAVEAVNQLMGH